jgi:hypothetical protein
MSSCGAKSERFLFWKRDIFARSRQPVAAEIAGNSPFLPGNVIFFARSRKSKVSAEANNSFAAQGKPAD